MILDPQNMFFTWSGVFWAYLVRTLLPKAKEKSIIPGQMMNMKTSLDQTKNTINLSSHILLDLGITSKRKSEMTKTIITSKKN